MILIPLWTDNNPEVKEILLPVNETEWSDLSLEEKQRVWKYLEPFFFSPNMVKSPSFNSIDCDYRFYGSDMWENDHLAETVAVTVDSLNNKYKRSSYARNFLEDSTYNNACYDFNQIFLRQDRDIVFELLTVFANVMVIRDLKRVTTRKPSEDEKSFEARKELEGWRRFDNFSKEFGKVLGEFGINYRLTRYGMLAADEPVVVDEIYMPALKKLSNKKWTPANRDLRDAFEAFDNDKDGSGALTHALAALQGILQILIYGKTGKGETAQLIKLAIKNKQIPDDDFSKQIINNMNAFWAKERQDKGDPHPKNTYATKKQARLVISQVMVFVDYIL